MDEGEAAEVPELVKAQPQPEHKTPHEAAKPGGSQPKPSEQVGPTR